MRRRSRTTTIFGPEPWKEIEGVAFIYWDRWLLRLAVEERDGLDGLVQRFQADRKRGRAGHVRRDAEAKLSQIEDLRERLTKIQMSPREVLGDLDASDKKLLAKSRTKLIEQGLFRLSRAMVDTPRRRLQARALRGWWPQFPGSPAAYEKELMGPRDRSAYCDWRMTMWLAEDVRHHIDRLEILAGSEAEQMALHRAAATLIVESMERTDDSHASLGLLFEDVWNAYLAMPWERTEILPEVFFRDLIEFSIWEEYGLVDGLTNFFRSLAPDDVAVVEDVFADVIPELREGGFEYQEEKALQYRVDFLVGQSLHDRFVGAAAELGSRAWMPILAMANAAVDAGKRPLAMSIFSAADQPGMKREYLRTECMKMLGEPPRSSSLRRVK